MKDCIFRKNGICDFYGGKCDDDRKNDCEDYEEE
jgi:hypothetical protein